MKYIFLKHGRNYFFSNLNNRFNEDIKEFNTYKNDKHSYIKNVHNFGFDGMLFVFELLSGVIFLSLFPHSRKNQFHGLSEIRQSVTNI